MKRIEVPLYQNTCPFPWSGNKLYYKGHSAVLQKATLRRFSGIGKVPGDKWKK
jgi:hypothetical protein